METLKIIDVLDSPYAIIQDQGEILFKEAQKFLEKNQQVIVSFQDIEKVTSGFCNAFIANIYREYSEVENLLEFRDYDHIPFAQQKIDNAIKLGKNPEEAKKLNEALSDLLD